MGSGLIMTPLLTRVAIFFVVHTTAGSPLQTQPSISIQPTPIIDDQVAADVMVKPTPVNEDEVTVKDHTSIVNSKHEEREKNREGHLKLTCNFLETNPVKVGRHWMHDGDMLLTAEQWQVITGRKATGNVFRRWPKDAVTGLVNVPFLFADNDVNQRAVFAAINHWETHTCIRFHLTDNAAQPHLRFIKGQGCYSYVGLVFQTGQDVSIGEGCTRLGIVVHEIGHALGFYHEQSHPERDDHVYINTDNILEDYRSNFDIISDIGNYSVAYDLSSVMHYPSKAFSANGSTTIATKDRRLQSVPGQRDGLSHRDILLANIIYGCSDTWLKNCNRSYEICKNEGFTGRDCKCVCRSGTSGPSCANVTHDYYNNLLQEYTEVVTHGTVITSPNYPNEYERGLKRIINIIAPKCFRPEITFSYFHLYQRRPYCGGNSCCYFDSLEIRTEAPFSQGAVLFLFCSYCDQDITAGQSFSSTGKQMVLYFETMSSYYRGWAANVTFIPVSSSNCPSDGTAGTSTTTLTAGTTISDKNTAAKVTTMNATDAISSTTRTTLSTTRISTGTTTRKTPTTRATTTETTMSVVTTSTTTETSSPTVGGIKRRCLLQHLDGRYYWTSPNYPDPYPNNIHCGLRVISDGGKIVVRLINFDLQPRDQRVCHDKLTIVALYDHENELCNILKWNQRVYVSPSFFYMKFSTDNRIVRRGFNISIEGVTSNCHMTFQETADSKGVIELPGLSYYEKKEEHCEYRVQAPEGYQVKLTALNISTDISKGCWKEYVLINLHGERSYPAVSSIIHCGSKNYQSLNYVTTGGVLSVAYKGRNTITKGMRATYSIVADIP
ncbi:blastula protease 10-like [Portunus trituberculatus]|uniref:blastula protease 10-like n=1 Tax=Portunus trituberculatus TaxID=210409 RepID=UPI001E1CE7BC|nr:blastula protease 10-like [Portunus trituberculatus]